MRWIGYILFFLFVFIITAHAENGGYIVEPHNPQNNKLIDTSGADATNSFWELPLWIQIAYISGLLLTFLGLFKIIPIVLGRIKNLLENQSRQAIFKYILNNPGCTIAEISDQKNINRGSAKYHLNKLEFEEKIILKKVGKFLRLFQNSGAFKGNEGVIVAHLKNETSRMLLWHILGSKDKLIVSEQEGKYKRYSVNTDAEMILLRFMPTDQHIRNQI
ncbi:MAG: winged helix-turn-helix transcriptional regulator [Candidatus Methanoperedens sp.]|nr:winged helix-turn-helix transcriptional regulator [Candidatus Methanoperedens sp.]